MGSMRHIQPHDVNSLTDQSCEYRLRIRGWTEGGDDLRKAEIGHLLLLAAEMGPHPSCGLCDRSL